MKLEGEVRDQVATQPVDNPSVVHTNPSAMNTTLYNHIFPVKHTSSSVGVGLYHFAKEKFPERFKLSVMDDIFASWLSDHDIPSWTELPSHLTLCQYKHDHITYLSTLCKSSFVESKDNAEIKQVSLTLANNGFSSPTDELKVFKQMMVRHNLNPHWCLLDRQEISDSLKTLLAYSERYLNTNQVDTKVFYNFSTERIEFKAFHHAKHTALCVSLSLVVLLSILMIRGKRCSLIMLQAKCNLFFSHPNHSCPQ